MKPSSLRLLRSIVFETSRPCNSCQQWRAVHVTARLRAAQRTQQKPQAAPSTSASSSVYKAPATPAAPYVSQKKEDDTESHKPRPLGAPIGMAHPPVAEGEHESATERQSWSEANKVKRQELQVSLYSLFMRIPANILRNNSTERLARPYFRDISKIKYAGGKSYLANPKIFKAGLSLYFPNFRGRTLASSSIQDTTPVLQDKISIVSFTARGWSEAQVQSFLGAKENPELQKLIAENKGKVQLVQIMTENNTLMAWITRLFSYRLRRQIPRKDWNKCFFNRERISSATRDRVGLLNSVVGYVYLVDEHCRIRWAASAEAESWERESLVKGVRQLLKPAELRRGD